MAASIERSPSAISLSPSSSSSSDLCTPLTSQSDLFQDNPFFQSISNDQFIAIIGGLGYIGSHTSLELLRAGYNVVIIDDLSNSYLNVFDHIEAVARSYCEEECQPMPTMRFERADYREAGAMKRILDQYVVMDADSVPYPSATHQRTSRIAGVIHFAGYKSVQESIKEPLKYYSNNVAGLIDFCQTLGSYNIKTFIFSSSATVYGSIANKGVSLKEEYCVHQPEEFIDHDGEYKTALAGSTGLTNPYGRTKWMCEAILADLALADRDWTILALRYFNPIGCDESGLLREDPRGTPTNLMPIVVNVITGLSPVLDVYGSDYPTVDGSAVRDYIHVTDLSCGHVAALRTAVSRRGLMGFRTYNIGSGAGNSVFDIVTAMESTFSTKIPLNIVERRSGDVGVCVAEPTRAETELNWKTERDLQACCHDIYNSIKLSKETAGLDDNNKNDNSIFR
ncbi:hypothetical protein V496_00410 [Pseudogymnoascus sp. VKM F-4515 (FW-2607)]|nr:hypothetical protein V496_00410 [Pseudogymnoascus sp. VKM F-4515 (FW-2607)]